LADLPINITKYLTAESGHIPWYTADLTFSYLDPLLATTEFYGDYRVGVDLLENARQICAVLIPTRFTVIAGREGEGEREREREREREGAEKFGCCENV
jgi:hypothetical protein